MKQSPTIVLSGGGSGGHITPLLSLARELKTTNPGCQIIYIGHKGDDFDSLKGDSRDFDFTAFIDAGKFRRYHGESLLSHLLDFKTLGLNIRDFFKVLGSVRAALKVLRKVKPDVVFSKGGFVAVPVGIAAKLLRVPIITHDSDTVPGLANRIVGRWAVINAVGMPAKYYNYPKDRTKFVGVPVSLPVTGPLTPAVRAEFKESLDIPEDSLILLVSGGGNGSKNINNMMLAVAPRLLESNLALRIIHIAGQKNQVLVSSLYKNSLPPNELKRVEVLGFTPDFNKYAVAADLILSRAGATSLAEFALLSKACVIVPSPFLAGGHQLKNARELEDRGAAVIVPEHVSPDELLVVLSELLNNPERRQELGERFSRLAKPQATAELAKIILRVAASATEEH